MEKNKTEPIIRQWTILQLIPVSPRWTTIPWLWQQLRDREMGTSKRNVERDLEKLEDLFRLQCDDSARPYKWSFPKDVAARSIPGMDVVTALAFHVTEEFARDLTPPQIRENLDPYLKQARNVLRKTGRRELEQWTDRVVVIPPGQRLLGPDLDREILDTVYEALLRGRQLSLRYRSRMRQGEPTKHPAASPLGLVVRANVTYLVCHLHKGPDPSHLALHRVESAEMLDQLVNIGQEFDLHDYVARGFFEYPVGKNMRLVARFSSDTAPHLLESQLSSDQTHKVEENGWVRIRATVQDTRQLRWWLLGFGPRVEVLSPKSLRQEMAEKLENATALYADPS